MTATKKTNLIKITGRDNWTERYVDNLERLARGPVVACQDNGAGRMVFWLKPKQALIMTDRKAITKDLQFIGLNPVWVERVNG